MVEIRENALALTEILGTGVVGFSSRILETMIMSTRQHAKLILQGAFTMTVSPLL